MSERHQDHDAITRAMEHFGKLSKAHTEQVKKHPDSETREANRNTANRLFAVKETLQDYRDRRLPLVLRKAERES